MEGDESGREVRDEFWVEMCGEDELGDGDAFWFELSGLAMLLTGGVMEGHTSRKALFRRFSSALEDEEEDRA